MPPAQQLRCLVAVVVASAAAVSALSPSAMHTTRVAGYDDYGVPFTAHIEPRWRAGQLRRNGGGRQHVPRVLRLVQLSGAYAGTRGPPCSDERWLHGREPQCGLHRGT